MATFSVITPSLNQGAYLGACLASVREAAREAGVEVQHIVIDGGSTDDSLSILRSAEGIEWVSEPDGGQTDAINRGLRRARADVVSYLCADDLLEREAFVLLRESMARDPSADVYYGDAYFLERTWKRRKTAGQFSPSRLRRGNFLLQPAVFWRTGVMEKFGLLDDSLRFCMDHEYWLRIGEGTSWHYIPEPLASCRLHADAKTWSQLVPAWDEARRMQRRYGLFWRPLRDALWMRCGGSLYYRAKRRLFAAWAERRGS